MGLPAYQKNEKFTYADYITWPVEERWELIHGIPYAMSPAPARIHQVIVREIVRSFLLFFTDKPCEVYFAPFDVRFPSGEQSHDDDKIDTVVQPDILVVCDRNKLDDKGACGAPDLIVEVLSPATATKDLKEKLLLYQEHGVQEYWIVNPSDQNLQILTRDLNGTYVQAGTYTNNDTASSVLFENLTIDMEQLFKSVKV